MLFWSYEGEEVAVNISGAHMGPNLYKQGFRDGWEAATNFLATYIQELLEPSLALAGAYEPAIDDADRHVVTLEHWRDDADAAHITPPTPVRSVQRSAIMAASGGTGPMHGV